MKNDIEYTITKLHGDLPGPSSIILAGVHGNERCGVEVLCKQLSKIKIKKGEVLFGYGNPKAIEANKRYIDTDLNRMFKGVTNYNDIEKQSYEYQRAQFLKPYLNQADVLLDIHASITPESMPFVICEPNAYDIVNKLPIKFVVSGFDNIEPGGTDFYMNSVGKIGICVECGYFADPKSLEIAEQSLYAFLKAREHINEGPTFNDSQLAIKMDSLYTTTSDDFNLRKPFEDFEEIEQGQIIGTDGDKVITANEKSIILFATNRKKKGSEGFLLGKKLV